MKNLAQNTDTRVNRGLLFWNVGIFLQPLLHDKMKIKESYSIVQWT